MEARTIYECARSSLESGSLQKVSSVRVQTLGNGAGVGELLGADQTVAGCPLPPLAAALSPSGSVLILTGKTKRSLSPSLSHGRHYFISSIMFVWYSSSEIWIFFFWDFAPQALRQWANFSAPLQTKSWSRSHRPVRTFGLFCNSDENVFNKHTQVPELYVTLELHVTLQYQE